MIKYNQIFLFLICLFSLVLLACNTGSGGQGEESITLDSVKLDQYIEVISSDDFMGRKLFTEGETKTINYLREQFQNLGLEPGNEGDYFQDVPMVEITPHPDPIMNATSNSQKLTFESGSDYVIYTQRVIEEVEVNNIPLVFCGYGIVAPEYDWNDYEGVDMEGKIAVVLVNDPGFQTEDDNFFKGNTMTYYGRWTYKYEEAARQGAYGLMIVHETNAAGYPWAVVKGGWTTPKLDLQTSNDNMDLCAVQGWFTLDASRKLFEASGKDLGKVFSEAAKPGFQSIPLEATLTTGLKNTLKKDVSRNVVAKITGAQNPNEYIIYSAHWDHFGIGEVINGDSIYNGALDNASGTASLLAIADAFMREDRKPARSMVFIALTGEEQGLLGSAYYAKNPIYPPEQTVANLNMDGMNREGKMKAIEIIGYGQSSLDSLMKIEAEAQGRYVLADSEPEKGYFFRSDHFNFAKIGIPAIFANGGYDHWTEGKEYAKEKSTYYRTNDYHRPSDEYVPGKFHLEGLIQDAQLYYNLGTHLANSKYWPEWRATSEFKSIREEMLN